MAREIAGRLRVKGNLKTFASLSVGGAGGDTDVDLPLARDGQGRLYVPGTSLAGPMRAWVHRAFGPDAAGALFGFQAGDRGHAARAFVEDALIDLGGADAAVEVRDGIGIERCTGATARRIKYNRAILPPGTGFPLAMTVELPGAVKSDLRNVVGHLLAALEGGEVGFGAARTRGFGDVKLHDTRVIDEDWGSKKGLLALLDDKVGGVEVQTADLVVRDGIQPAVAPRIVFSVDSKSVGALMVKSGLEGIAVDALPLAGPTGTGTWALLLPGSGIKGALRFQAERIVRTLLHRDAPGPVGTPEAFLAAVQVPLVEHLFGAGKPPDAKKSAAKSSPKPGTTSPPGKGALSVADCHGTRSFTAAQWTAVVSAETGEGLAKALGSETRDASMEQAHHVGADRWTGGAAENILFSALEPLGESWGPLQLTLDLDRLPKELHLPAVALMLLLLRDLAGERIPFGYGSNRGLGSLKATGFVLNGRGLDGGLAGLAGKHTVGTDLAGLAPETLKALDEAWKAWVKSVPREVAG